MGCKYYEIYGNITKLDIIQIILTTKRIIYFILGVPLVDGGTVRLPAVVGLSRALDLILTGKSLNAKEAFDWGLVNRIVACGTSKYLQTLI